MKTFLIRATITEKWYMNDNDKNYEDIRIVLAEDNETAKDKYRNFWIEKDDLYCVSYWADIDQCNEAIT